jgi:wyosine [tRNA(Phe)-imidazoG37] synthetase (radical SAM superfamily)
VNCEILDTLYVRSNGDVPCDDDAGEGIILGRIGPDPVSVDSLLRNESFSHIRAALRSGVAPWPGVCERCAFYRPFHPPTDGLGERRIRKIQIEPSLACRLRCPACSNHLQIRYRPKPWTLARDTLSALLSGLVREQYRVDEVEYCGQGEPLLHPSFASLVDAVRSALPNTRQRLITSGNVEYATTVGGRALEEIFVSCDGLHQSSYEKYRVRGDVAVALRFLEDIPPVVDGIRQMKVWKYILFEFNDSDEEITETQQRAQDLGVDVMIFVFTHSKHRSERWTAENVAEFPILFPNVTTSATPIHDQLRRDGIASAAWTPTTRFGRRTAHVEIDEMVARGSRVMARGWAWRRGGLDSLELRIDGQPVGVARIGLPRPDVAQAFPDYGPRTGFAVSGALPCPLSHGDHQIEVGLRDEAGTVAAIGNHYVF